MSSVHIELALSPDCATGYATSANGTLFCMDTRAAIARQSSVTGAVDLAVTDDGRVWWLTRSGQLYVTKTCGTQPSTPMAFGHNDVQAVGVDPADKLIVTLTPNGGSTCIRRVTCANAHPHVLGVKGFKFCRPTQRNGR